MEAFNMKSIIFLIALSSILSLYKAEASAKAPAPSQDVPKDKVNAIKHLCDKTDFPSECVSSSTPFISQNDVDPLVLLRAGMKALTQRIDEAIKSFEDQKSEKKFKTSDAAERLEVCLAYYRVATTSAQDAETAINEKNYTQLKEELDRQLEVIGDCDDLFAESVKGRKGPLEDVNTSLTMLAKNNLALAQDAVPLQ